MTGESTEGSSRLPRRAGSRLQRLGGRLPLALLIVGMTAQGILLFHLVRHSWFGSDDFTFFVTRGPVPGHDLGVWRPYAGHWSTVPVLIYRALFGAVGLHTYLPYVGVAIAVHLAGVLAMYLLLRSLDARPWPALLACWVLLFYGAGAEAYMTAASMNHTLPLLLAAIACQVIVRTGGSDRGVRTAAVIGVVIVMCSATGLTALLFLGGLVAVRNGLRSALRVVGPAGVAFGVWLVAYGRSGGRAAPHLDSIQQVPAFLWEGITTAGGSGLGVTRTGGVLLCVGLAIVIRRRLGPSSLRAAAWVGAGAAVVHLTLVTLGDARLGSNVASAGRYVYVVLFLLMPGFALLAQVVADQVRARAAAVLPRRAARWVSVATGVVLLALLVAYTRVGTAKQQDQAVLDRGNAGVYKGWAYGSISAVDAGERQLSFHWGFLGAPFELLASPSLRSQMPAPPHEDVRLAAEAQWFVVVGTNDPGLFSPTHPSVQGSIDEGIRPAGCHDVPHDGKGPVVIDVPTGTGTEIGVISDSTRVTTQLFRDFTPSPIRTWPVPKGPLYVATTAKDAVLRVVLNGRGPVGLCHQ